MKARFSPKISDILTYSREEAVRLGNEIVTTDHLFLGIIRDGDSEAFQILNAFPIDLTDIRKKISII